MGIAKHNINQNNMIKFEERIKYRYKLSSQRLQAQNTKVNIEGIKQMYN